MKIVYVNQKHCALTLAIFIIWMTSEDNHNYIKYRRIMQDYNYIGSTV